MRIRLAGPDDLSEIVRGTYAFARQGNFENVLGDATEASISALIGLDVVRIYLAETDEIVGGLGVSIVPIIWNQTLTEMSELFFWVYPESPAIAALMLLRRAIKDAETEKVSFASFTKLSTSPEKVGRIYERLGFVKTQETYVREF